MIAPYLTTAPNPFTAQAKAANPLDALRLWFARWLLPSGYRAVPTAPLADLERRLVKLHGLTWTSGHLTRAYHVGRVVRQESEAALDALLLAQGRDGFETNGTYASPALRQDLQRGGHRALIA